MRLLINRSTRLGWILKLAWHVATHLSLESPEVPKLCATRGQYRFFITRDTELQILNDCEKRQALRKRSWIFFWLSISFHFLFFLLGGGVISASLEAPHPWCSPMLRHWTWRSNGWVVSGHCGMWRQRDRVPWNGNSWCLSRWVNRPLGVAMPSTFWPWVRSKDSLKVYGNPCLNQPLKEGVF